MFVRASRAGGSSDLRVFWFGAPQPSWFFQATCLCTESNATQTSSADTQGNPRVSHFKATNGERNIAHVHGPRHHQQAPEYLQTQVKAPSTTSFHSNTGQQTHGTFLALPQTRSHPRYQAWTCRAHQHAHGERTGISDAQQGSALASKLHLDLYVRVQQGPELQHHPPPVLQPPPDRCGSRVLPAPSTGLVDAGSYLVAPAAPGSHTWPGWAQKRLGAVCRAGWVLPAAPDPARVLSYHAAARSR